MKKCKKLQQKKKYYKDKCKQLGEVLYETAQEKGNLAAHAHEVQEQLVDTKKELRETKEQLYEVGKERDHLSTLIASQIDLMKETDY
jgi:hypothetical protein